MQTIITPTDFSNISINAVNYAADMAAALQVDLLVLHTTELPISSGRSYDEQADIETEERLNTLKDSLLKRTNGKIPIQTKQVVGLIEGEIIKMCAYKNPLAVVMATKGASMKKQFFMESITVYLSRNLNYPVIVVPSNVHYKPVNKILLATDLENIYSMPVEKIKNIVKAFNARLDIVHVYSKEDKSEIMISRMTELTRYLDSLDPQLHFLFGRDIYKAIISFATENKSDIILTFPKKHQFFHKSQSKQLVFNAPFTVMTIQ